LEENRMKRSLFAVLSLLVLASMMLAACGGSAGDVGSGPIPFPEGGKSVTGAFDQEPDAIVPYFSQMSYAIWMTQMTLAGLGEWDAEGNFIPELAAELPSADNGGVSADGLTIT